MLGREPLPAWGCESPPHKSRWKQKCAQRVGRGSRGAAVSAQGAEVPAAPHRLLHLGLGEVGDHLPRSCPPQHALPRAAAEAGCPCGLLSQRAAASLSPSLGSGVVPEGPSSGHQHGAGAPGEQEDRLPGLPSGLCRCVSARPTNPRPRSMGKLHLRQRVCDPRLGVGEARPRGVYGWGC